MVPDLDRLPRTIDIVRAGAEDAPIPVGFPIVTILDQTKLPDAIVFDRITDWREVIEAIKHLKVRGAPAIGIAGACAMVLRAAEFCYAQSDIRDDEAGFDRVFIVDDAAFDPKLYIDSLKYCALMIERSRPTAVNLKWALDQCVTIVEEVISDTQDPQQVTECLYEFAKQLMIDDENANRSIGANGASLLPCNARVLTHCNAGSLATAFYGTALGVVYAAAAEKGIDRVFADETRPVCQGSRLTAWELAQVGIPVTLICDDMAATVLSQKMVDAVIVGADRIAANGDVANKIGTLGLAVMAKEFGVPFYVAAPTSTIDADCQSGCDIVIEQRSPEEVLAHPIDGVDVFNPAFDITPAKYIDAIITERGVYSPSEVLRAIQV